MTPLSCGAVSSFKLDGTDSIARLLTDAMTDSPRLTAEKSLTLENLDKAAGSTAIARAHTADPQSQHIVWELLDRAILPEHFFVRRFWSMVVAFLLLYTATLFPLRLAFWEFQIPAEPGAEVYDSKSDPFWLNLGWLIDILFWIDLGANFFISYENTNFSSRLLLYFD